jgi:hypothetical protein
MEVIHVQELLNTDIPTRKPLVLKKSMSPLVRERSQTNIVQMQNLKR